MTSIQNNIINENGQIVVYDGTDHYRKKVVEKLVNKGQSVKVVSRN